MIILILKYPWKFINDITVGERRVMYDCAIGLMQSLVMDIRRATQQELQDPRRPGPALLQEFAIVALSCPGFSEKQKASFVGLLNHNSFRPMADGRHCPIKLGGNNEFSSCWPFSALDILPDADPDVVRFYARVFRETIANNNPNTSLAEIKAAELSGRKDCPMGDWNINYGSGAGNLALSTVASIEWSAIEAVLRQFCSQTSRHRYA
jgi:hypothetical protein